MPRKSAKKTSAPKTSVRLKDTEQVRDRLLSAVGFGSAKAVYQPYSALSIEQLRDLLLTTVWAEACIETIVDEVVKYPLYPSDNDEEISSFLRYPSLKEPLFMIRKQYLGDMLRWGNGACIIEYKQKKPHGLVVTPGYSLRVTDGEPQTYKLLELGKNNEFLKKGNTDMEFKSKEIMHFCINKQSDTTLGIPSLQRAYNDILTDKQIAIKLVQFVQRGFFKPSFLSFKKGSNVTKAQLEEFVEYLNSLIQEGVKVLGVNKEVDVTDLPTWSAAEIIEMERWVGLKTASVFKVPPFMLNLVQDVGSLNAREQKARFLENVVMPILEYESFIYTNVLARQGFENLDADITSHMLGTKLNYDRARIANLLVGSGESIMTVDEVRKLFFHLDPKPTGDA